MRNLWCSLRGFFSSKVILDNCTQDKYSFRIAVHNFRIIFFLSTIIVDFDFALFFLRNMSINLNMSIPFNYNLPQKYVDPQKFLH